MASLIKRNTAPIKFQSLRAALVLPRNRLLSANTMENWENLDQKYAQFEQEVRKLIVRYQSLCINKGLIAYKRGQIRQQTIIMRHIIYQALSWQKNLDCETKSIVLISYKIAETILDNSEKITNSQRDYQVIYKKLKNYFYIKISLPKQLSFLKENFKHSILLTSNEHDTEPQVMLCINKQIHHLSLAGINLERIFR